MIGLIAKQPRDLERQVAFIKVDGIEFSCGNVPIGLTRNSDILAYLQAREGEFKLLIFRKSYPKADINGIPQKENATEIEKWNEWIKEGHKNRIQIGLTKAGNPKYGYDVIEKQRLEYKHPRWVGLHKRIDASLITKETKNLLKEALPGIGSLEEAQMKKEKAKISFRVKVFSKIGSLIRKL